MPRQDQILFGAFSCPHPEAQGEFARPFRYRHPKSDSEGQPCQSWCRHSTSQSAIPPRFLQPGTTKAAKPPRAAHFV